MGSPDTSSPDTSSPDTGGLNARSPGAGGLNAAPLSEPAGGQIDQTLSLLASVQPRQGLESRLLARLHAAPARESLPRRILAPRWAAVAASVLAVAGAAGVASLHLRPATTAPSPILRVPRAAAAPVATSAGVAGSPRPHQNQAATHRGIRRSYRAMHPERERSGMPPGTVIPTRPQTVPLR